MASFTTVFLDQFTSMTRNNFNQGEGIWYPQDAIKRYHIELEEYQYGLVPPEFFKKCLSPKNNRIPFAFALREGKTPSNAIHAIERTFTLLDSGCAYMFVFYRALCSYLGEEKFNAFYGRDRFILRAEPWDTWTRFFFDKVSIASAADIQPGDQCCFKNMLAYSVKHLLHEDYYLVYSGDNQFMGLGFKGNTKSEVQRALRRQFNEPSEVNTTGLLRTHTVTYSEFIKIQTNPPFRKDGRLVLEVLRPNWARIAQLADTALDELDVLIEEWERPLKRQYSGSPSI